MLEEKTDIVSEVIVPVRFSEVDSLQIVWHGHYIRYFEDAREAFGNEHNLGYLTVYAKGYSIPIVNITCNYKAPAFYGDTIRIVCRYMRTPAAKLIFQYEIYNQKTGQLLADGKSTQVFLDLNKQLQWQNPAFFEDWKQQKLA